MTDRAQAETLGFSSVFGLVMLMILIVSVAVYPAIADVEDHQRVSNVERGMVSLSGNVDDVVRSDAPSRSTRLRLGRGQLALGAPVNVTVEGTSNDSFSETYAVRPLVYRSGEGTKLVYVSGAVIRADEGGTAVVREPRMLVSNESLLLPVVQLRQGSGPSGVSGTTRVVTAEEERRVPLAAAASGEVNVTVESPRAEAWRRIFEARGMDCSSPSSGAVTCSASTDRVYVTLVRLRTSFR